MEAAKNWARRHNLALAIFMAFLMLLGVSVDFTSYAAEYERGWNAGFSVGYERGLKDAYIDHYEPAFIEELESGRGWGGGYGSEYWRGYKAGAWAGYQTSLAAAAVRFFILKHQAATGP